MLESIGLRVFLAHESIKLSDDWRSSIKKALALSDVFLAILTSRFHISKWTDQEVGMAIAWGIPIITLQFDKKVYGFMAQKNKSVYEFVNSSVLLEGQGA